MSQKDELMEALTDSSVLTILRMTLPFVIPIAEYVSLGPAGKAAIARKQAFQDSKEKLARHREEVMTNPETAPPSIFAELFSAEEQGSLTQEEVVSNAITILANGTDPTANTLTYLVWAVCRRPEVRVQLLEEIDSLPDGFQDSHLKELSYLNQVIEETLRLYPAIGGSLERTVPPHGATLAGHPIPPGTIVSCQAYSMHRDPSVFSNPGIFHPDRWDSPTAAMRDAMMAWGGGSRSEFIPPLLWEPGPRTLMFFDLLADIACAHSLPWDQSGTNDASSEYSPLFQGFSACEYVDITWHV